VITALLFFMTLLAHELSHALVGRAYGLRVRSITLFALGGVASIEREPASAKVEFWMALAGPVTSIAIGLGCLAVAQTMGWTLEGSAPGPAAATLGWLGSINVVLAVFNLIPGYPLDGGRVLRAILWAVSGNAERATRRAARVGQAVAGGFIIIGLVRFFGGADAGGLWLAFIGWFLMDAAGASYAEAALRTSLQGIRAADLLRRDCDTVSGGVTLEAFADLLLRTGRRCFMVTRPDGSVEGLITPQEVRAVNRGRWPDVRVGEAMRPLSGLKTVTPATLAVDVLAIMIREDVNQVPVMAEGQLAGIITRADLLRLIQTRAELA
jgi:Zn-dependent protease/predicted transcriptional regulator